MARIIYRKSKKAGLPPGSLVHIGEKKAERTKITVIDYDERELKEIEAGVCEECFPFKGTPTVTWINVDGVHDSTVIEKIGAHFELHPLVLEDIMTTVQRPKMEDYGDYLFVVMRMLRFNGKKKAIESEQVSLILGSNFVISFQESEGDVFDAVRTRIRTAKGRVRKMGADYLAYTLMDAVVDEYFLILEKFGEIIEILEEELVREPGRETLRQIHALKREMIYLRKSVWPLREVAGALERSDSPLIKESTAVFLRDVYDHTIQVIETMETYRDMLSGMLDMYLSSVSNKMNEVMKVLTIIATIFIPLTFIAGIYGMNFQYMPELGWHWGYFVVLLAMVFLTGFMIFLFKRKKWL